MKGIVLRGKAWEIRHLLKKYSKQFTYVYEWIDYEDKKVQGKYGTNKLFLSEGRHQYKPFISR